MTPDQDPWGKPTKENCLSPKKFLGGPSSRQVEKLGVDRIPALSEITDD